MLRRWLELPETRGMDVDDPRTTIIRKDIIRQKGFLRCLYTEWYARLARSIDKCGHRGDTVLELGAGGGFFQEHCREKCLPWRVLASDVMSLPGLDLVLDARSLPFAPGSLTAIVMTNVFHHIPDVRSFLASAAQALRPGDVLAMIEPWNTPWSRFVYARLHPEPFLPDSPYWTLDGDDAGRALSNANDALPWIVFARDRDIFARDFHEFASPEITPLMPFSYLASGGVSLRSLLPGCAYGVCRWLEDLLPQRFFAMFAQIVLQKRIAQ